MYKVVTPTSNTDFDAYFQFRWAHLRQPWNFPPGSEKDEYEQVAEHRMIVDGKGNIVACGRVHLNTAEEAQIRHIAVDTHHQRKGLGQMMMSALENVAKELGAERAVTNSREISIDFFTSCGFYVEREAPNELGMLKRQQMVKKLTENNSLVMHPKWCKSLQQTWWTPYPLLSIWGLSYISTRGARLKPVHR